MVNQVVMSILIPFKLTFMEHSEDWSYVYYDIFLDILFFLDILIRFNTPIYEKGKLITNRKKIAKVYL